MATATEIAEWMPEQLPESTFLSQSRVAYHIRRQFGEEFTHLNKNGVWGIRRDVLDEFQKLRLGTVVWSQSTQARRREQTTAPEGRMIRSSRSPLR